jgi:hypothetical protein
LTQRARESLPRTVTTELSAEGIIAALECLPRDQQDAVFGAAGIRVGDLDLPPHLASRTRAGHLLMGARRSVGPQALARVTRGLQRMEMSVVHEGPRRTPTRDSVRRVLDELLASRRLVFSFTASVPELAGRLDPSWPDDALRDAIARRLPPSLLVERLRGWSPTNYREHEFKLEYD